MATSPFAVYRDRINKTQADMASVLEVTRHYYLRLEQGLYHEIPAGVLAQLSSSFNVGASQLKEEYRAFQKDVREVFRDEHASFKKILHHYTGLLHPLVYYREVELLTRMGLCKGLCLHYDGVTQYESNSQRGVPLDIKLACSDIYWDYSYLESAVSEWRQSGRADRNAKKSA